MATGAPPFGDGKDALRLVHDHLARVPVAPRLHNPAIPASLSEIILRLLEKEPDRRYQSASGLAHDLGIALRRWQDQDGESFPLGERDFPLRLSPPSQLVGREAEIVALKESFARAVAGTLHGLLLAGAPGVGKTSLMNELRQVVTACDGWLVSGKFDQYHRGQASDAINQCMGALAQLLLAEPESELASLKARITSAVGRNAGLLATVVPELRHLLGLPAPDGADAADDDDTAIDPVEAERRLHQAGLDVLRAVVSPSRPLVFIVDDLQWGSSMPLAFIDLLLTSSQLPGMLVVAAYRDNEVDATHPLSGMLTRWLALDVPPRHLRVTNLPAGDLEHLLTTMLRLPSAPPPSLTSVVQAATDGNPFDTVELVNALRRRGALSLHPDGWAWDGTKIGHDLDGNVTDLVDARIAALPPATVVLLETMALLGGEVPLEVLQVATGPPRPESSGNELSEQLRPALEDGLLLMEPEAPVRVRFAHDRVHQAAFARVPPDRRRVLGLTLARAFAATPGYQIRAAEQYQPVAEDITDPAERHLAATVMRSAAERQALANPSSALGLLDAALGLLRADGAAPDAQLLGQLQAGRHAALYRLGRLEQADAAFESVRGCHPEVLELVPTARDQINSLCNRGLYTAAVQLGVELLAQLGIDRPEQLEAAVNAELDEVLRWLRGADPEVEAARPPCTDPGVHALAQLCQAMLAPGFFADPGVSFWVTLLSLRLWSTRGPCPANYGAIGFAPFVVMAWRQDYRSAMALLDVIMQVGYAHGFDDHMFPARFHALFVEHWFHPLANDLDKARDIRAGLLRAGDIQTVSFTNHVATAAAWECSPTLDGALAEIESALDFARRIGDEHTVAMFETYLPLIFGLTRDEASTAAQPAEQPTPASPMATGYFHVNQALLAVLFADLPACSPHAAAALPLLPAFDGHHHIVWAHALHALCTAQRIAHADPDDRGALLAEMDEHVSWLDRRAQDSPDGFAHLTAWLRAERAAALGDTGAAALAFDQALDGFRRHGRIWHQALISERA
ncbi:MAG: AAA family ATPase, partial [Kineosporiaceae bacterium]